jgi:uncharacterized protein YndB with AHSA1/START domain
MNLTKEAKSVLHNTFVIQRTYPVPPERVFAAFADATRKRRWFAEGDGHAVEEFTMDFRVGGNEKARFRSTKPGPYENVAFTAHGSYQDIVANRRVVIASTMSVGDQRISASLATFDLVPDDNGTELIFTHQAAFFEGADGPEMREAGWRKLLENLDRELRMSES